MFKAKIIDKISGTKMKTQQKYFKWVALNFKTNTGEIYNDFVT